MGACKSNMQDFQIRQSDYAAHFLTLIKSEDEHSIDDLETFLEYFSQYITSYYIRLGINYLLYDGYIHKLFIVLNSRLVDKIMHETYYKIIVYSTISNWDVIVQVLTEETFLELINYKNALILYTYSASKNDTLAQKNIIKTKHLKFNELSINTTNPLHEYLVDCIQNTKHLDEIKFIAMNCSLWYGIIKEYTDPKFNTSTIRSALIGLDYNNIEYIFEHHHTLVLILRHQLKFSSNYDIINIKNYVIPK